MLYFNPKVSRRLKSQEGFVMIVAIMAVMILIAVGFFALTVSTQDMRISSRLLGERKAFSAAEAGINEVCRTLNPANRVPIYWTKVDATNDPNAEWSATAPTRNTNYPSIAVPGSDLTDAFAGAVFDTAVTGRETSYNSRVNINVGIAYTPSPSDTQQGGL